ncbi:ligand-binding sensor domain-containing protein [Aliarcobacter butzleri]|uniref:hypothetical protein n=1 Tax=Aliarcobacter butzleri TaxID=28197 RepID=UPI00125FEF77|nr:hypothetical protein [Aliarcobacter butzleri]
MFGINGDKKSSICAIFVFIFLCLIIVCLYLFEFNSWYFEVYMFFCQILEINDLSNFLIVLITIYVGILSFMIPISIQMIGNISKDFPSTRIENRFKNELIFKTLPIILLLQILVVTLTKLYTSTSINIFLISLIVLFLVITLGIIYLYIIKLINYSDKDFIVNLILKDTKEYIYYEKDIEKSIKNLQFYGGILFKEIQHEPDPILVDKLIEELKNLSNLFLDKNTKILDYNKLNLFKETIISLEKSINKSIELQNYELTDKLKLAIHQIMKKILENDNNHSYLNQFFDSHNRIFIYSIKIKSPYQASFTYHWYSNFVFNWLDNSYIFNEAYLNRFDKQQFSYMRYIISENRFNLFKGAIGWFHHGLGFFNSKSLYGTIKSIDSEERRMVLDLDRISKDIKTFESLEQFLIKFDKYEKKIVDNPLITEEIKKELQLFKKEAYSKYYLFNLKNMIFGIASYCIYKNRYKYIKELWHYKNPQDSMTHWIGHEIYPSSISEILDFIIENGDYDRKFSFNEDHHDSDIYEKMYELYLIGYIINTNEIDLNNKFIAIKDISKLNSLKYSIGELEKNLSNVYNTKNLEKFIELGFSNINEDRIQILESKLKKLFSNLKNECLEIIQNIEHETNLSINYINEFKKNIIKNRDKFPSIKNLIEKFDLYNKIEEIRTEFIQKFDSYLPRTMFFEDGVDSVDSGDYLSEQLIEIENKKIIRKIIDNSEVIELNQIEEKLALFKDIEDTFILDINYSKYFDTNKFFTDNAIKKSTMSDIDSYFGDFEYNKIQIPVFEYFIHGIEECIILLNKNKLLEFNQYLPNNKGLLIDNILINVTDLKDIEDKKDKAIVEVSESFDIKMKDNFMGYIIYIQEEDN